MLVRCTTCPLRCDLKWWSMLPNLTSRSLGAVQEQEGVCPAYMSRDADCTTSLMLTIHHNQSSTFLSPAELACQVHKHTDFDFKHEHNTKPCKALSQTTCTWQANIAAFHSKTETSNNAKSDATSSHCLLLMLHAAQLAPARSQWRLLTQVT